ncbi:LysR family transcriptional regulator [Gordonia sp. CPCC 205333]|uniref:LysR family transcriptional regulator n=1 Tax=Gordonia sp. CPCC 205333 TaxID=3140790 RepID=UPI003AF3DB69
MTDDWFVTLAETQNMSETARRLHIAQPTLSRMLTRLEREVGAPLFDRLGKRLALNTAGTIYLDHLRRAVAEITIARNQIADLTDANREPIRLAFLHSFGVWLVPTLIRDYRRQYGPIDFTLSQGPAEAIADQVRTGDADFAITSPRPRSDEIAFTLILRQHLALAVPDSHALTVRDRVSLADAANESFIAMEPGFGMRRILDELCAAADIRPHITFESTELWTVAGLVAAGLGVAVMPIEDTPQLPAGMTMIPLDDPQNTREVGLIWARNRSMSLSTNRFRDHVRQWARTRRT